MEEPIADLSTLEPKGSPSNTTILLNPELSFVLSQYAQEKASIKTAFIEMAKYHIENYDRALSFDYNDTMNTLYEKVAFHSLRALELIRSNNRAMDKNKRDEILGMLEDLPRKLAGFNVPLTLDLVFRADGHAFSKLFYYFKKADLQPFSLAITRAFILLVRKFSQSNEFIGMQTFYLCSDEITGKP